MSTKAKHQAGFSLAETVLALLIFSLAASVLLPNAVTSSMRMNKERLAADEAFAMHNLVTSHLLGIAENVSPKNLEISSSDQTDPGSQLRLQRVLLEEDGVIWAEARQIMRAP